MIYVISFSLCLSDSRGDIAGNDENFEFEEMSIQEDQFFSMSYEFMEMDRGENATQLLLKYCPESFQHLLDRCLIKRNRESDQVFIYSSEQKFSIFKLWF